MKKRKIIGIGTVLAFLPLLPVHAQRFTHSFRNTSLSEALTLLAKNTKNYHINFMYNELEDFTVTTNIVKRNPLDAIQQIIGFYPVKITIDGQNIFVECTQKAPTKMMGRIIDSHRRAVDFANVALLSSSDSSFITGGVTNEDGRFVIPCEARRAIVKVSCVGYQTTYGTYDMIRVLISVEAWGTNYVFNERHSLGATYEGNINPYGRGGWNSHFDVWKNGTLSEGYDNEYVAGFKARPTHDLTAYYAGQISKVHIDWNGEIYLHKSGQTQYSQEQNTIEGGSRIIESDYMADSWMHATKLVLSVPVWKGTMRLGSEYTESCRANLYIIDEQGDDLPGKTDDQVKESNLAVFASYGVKLNRLELNAGLRYEHVSSNYINKGKDVWDENHQESQPDLSRKYVHLFPQLSLMLPIKQVKLGASYRVTVVRPSYRQLSSNVQYNSRYYYQGGNPLLQPTYSHTVSLNIGYRWLQLFANWHEVEDLSYWCIEPYKESSNELISMYTYRNLKHARSCNVGLTASPKIGWWQPTLNASLRKQWMQIDGMHYEHPLFVGSLNNEIMFPHDWIFHLDMDYHSNGHSGTIDWRQQGGVDVSLNKSFLHDRLNVTVVGYDLFASRRTTSRLVYGTSNVYNWKYTDTRKLVLSLSYKFNVARSKYKGTGAGKAEKNRL